MIRSDRYDGSMDDLFAFQDDVTAMTAARLAVQISAAEQRRLLADDPPDLRAYGLILRGQDLSLRFRQKPISMPADCSSTQRRSIPTTAAAMPACRAPSISAWRYHWTPDPAAALDQAVDLANAAIGYDSLDARGFGELGFARLDKSTTMSR